MVIFRSFGCHSDFYKMNPLKQNKKKQFLLLFMSKKRTKKKNKPVSTSSIFYDDNGFYPCSNPITFLHYLIFLRRFSMDFSYLSRMNKKNQLFLQCMLSFSLQKGKNIMLAVLFY